MREQTGALPGRQAALLIVVAASGVMVATPVTARSASPSAGRISFYGDIGNLVNGPYRQNPLVVRPSTLHLAEDGSVALVDLRWSGWGTGAAQATGVWSASNCMPDCADGKRTTSPARLTLSSPGRVLGHFVYRCFQVTVSSHRQWNYHECIRQQGGLYGYAPVSGWPRHP